MGSSEIRAGVASVRQHLVAHPEDRVGSDSPAVATLRGALVTVVSGPAGQVETDMPKPLGGGGSAPTPGWYLRAGIASCTASVIAIRAAELGVRIDHLEIRVDSRSDEAGMLGLDEKAHAGPIEASMTVHIKGRGRRSGDTARDRPLGHRAFVHGRRADAGGSADDGDAGGVGGEGKPSIRGSRRAQTSKHVMPSPLGETVRRSPDEGDRPPDDEGSLAPTASGGTARPTSRDRPRRSRRGRRSRVRAR